jgi:hypothetical protein
MEFYKEGDHSKAICGHCKKIVPTTFTVRRANLKDGDAILVVPNVLVSVCDVCDRTVGVPQQSFAAVSEVRSKTDKVSLDVRLARHQLDILNNVLDRVGITATSDLRSHLLRYCLASVDLSSATLKRLRQNLSSDLLEGSFPKSSRFSIKLNDDLNRAVAAIVAQSALTKTQLIESVIVKIKKDVLDDSKKSVIEDLRRSLLASA